MKNIFKYNEYYFIGDDNIILIFLVAISLSMDAFFLSLAYGALKLNKKAVISLSTIVGAYHFIMPLLGMYFGKAINLNNKYIVSIIFFIIGINMILDIFKEKEIKPLSLIYMLLFGLSVSLDSFSVGIGLNYITDSVVLCSIVFSLTSFVFTFLGLLIGKKINELIGDIAILLGGLTIITLGVYYIVGV